MTDIFKLSLIAVSAGALLAGSAEAQAVRVSVIGKDAKVVHAEFLRAARKLCADQNSEITYSAESDHAACMRATVAKAEIEYSQIKSQQIAMVGGQ